MPVNRNFAACQPRPPEEPPPLEEPRPPEERLAEAVMID